MVVYQTKECGVTLMQLLISLAIVAILAVLGIPSIIFLIENNRVKAAAENFYQQANYARSEAVKKRSNTYLVVKSGSIWCVGINSTNDCDCSVTKNCSSGNVDSTEFKNVTLSTSGINNSNMMFDGLRGTTSGSGSATFTINSKAVTVDINSMGRVRICSNNVVGYPACS